MIFLFYGALIIQATYVESSLFEFGEIIRLP